MKVLVLSVLCCCLAMARGEVPQELDEVESPPLPYSFSYAAGRYPGHVDRTHSEISDGSGVVRGSFAYVDPTQHVRTVEYTADQFGFHPVLSDPVADTPTVAAAKVKHLDLYQRIAAEHARIAADQQDSAEQHNGVAQY